MTWLLILLLPFTTGDLFNHQTVTQLEPSKPQEEAPEKPPAPSYLCPIKNRDLILMAREASHRAIDFPAPFHTPIYASASGQVVFAGWYPLYGKVVFIQHSNAIQTRYAHLDRFLVEKGDHVSQGQIVGLMGITGRTTGSHLHYEMWEGMPDPSDTYYSGWSSPQKMDPFTIIEKLNLHQYQWVGRLKDSMTRDILYGNPKKNADADSDDVDNADARDTSQSSPRTRRRHSSYGGLSF